MNFFNITIFNQINENNAHPIYSAQIQTHDLWNMGLLP